MSQEDELEEENRPAVDQLDQLRSYGLFVVRAIRKRLLRTIALWGVGLAIVFAVYWVWPRSYYCESTLMVHGNALLDDEKLDPLGGASSLVYRHSSLLAIVKETGLARRVLSDRPALLRFKDRITGTSGLAERDLELLALGTVAAAISVHRSDNNLTIGAEWGNAEMAARLVELTQKSFLEARHVAEISTIAERMSILDGHSTELRKEIDTIAGQLKDVRDEKLAEIGKASRTSPSATTSPSSPPKPRPSVRVQPTQAVSQEDQLLRKEKLAELQAELEQKKRALDELKGDRGRRLLAAQEQRTALLGTYTPAHPEVRKVERMIESLSGDSPQAAALKREIETLADEIQGTRSARPSRAPLASGSAPVAAPESQANLLPTEILKLLESGADFDPAATVQLEGAVSKYASLRDAIRTARVDLDTAQAAFNHRYKIVAPAEVPVKPSKPDRRKVFGIGFLLTLFIALLVPIIAELRSGRIVARWQVQNMELPILAELRLPGNRD